MTFDVTSLIDWDMELLNMRHMHHQQHNALFDATGFDERVLNVMHNELGGVLSPRDLLKMMTYIHLAPTPRDFAMTMGSSYHSTLTALHGRFEFAATVLRNRMDSSIRYDLDNHSVFFPCRVTAVFDTLPLQVTTCADGLERVALWSAKHGFAALEFGTVTDLRGRLLEVTGPHRPALGPAPHLAESAVYRSRKPSELFLGDQAYQATDGFLTVVRPHDADRVLTALERLFNHSLCSARAAVEHANQNCFHRHRLFQTPLRLGERHITHIVQCVAFAEHVRLRLNPPRPGFGIWPFNIDGMPELWEGLLKAAYTLDKDEAGE